jgi:hypothetical protein
LLLVNVTTKPPDGAAPVRVTVPVEEVPPDTEAGLTLTELSVAAVTVRVAACVDPRVAEMDAEALDATGLAVTTNVAVVALALTLTVAGTWAAPVLLLNRVTTAPPAGAAALRVTVPVDDPPPVTEAGLRVIEAIITELKLMDDWLAPLIVML